MPAPQITHVPFGGGLDEGTGQYIKPAGKLITATNAHINYDGTIEHRARFESLGAGKFPASAATPTMRMFSRGDELCATDGRTLYTWSAKQTQWIEVDSVAECNVTGRIPALRGTNAYAVCDGVYCNGVYVSAWNPGGGILYARVIDATTGAFMYDYAWSNSLDATNVRLCVLGTKVYWFASKFNSGGKTRIYCRILDTAGLASGWSA